MLRLILLATSFLLLPANATISILFNFEYSGGVPQNFADSSGTVRNGMVYGIAIDNDGDGFLAVYDSGFSLTQGSLLTLTNSGTDTDDQIFISLGVNQDYLTHDTSSSQEGDFTTTGGDGGIAGATSVPASAEFKDFAVIWFDFGQAINTTVTDGTHFGLLTDATFVMPADGASAVERDAPFVGVDPVRPANFGTFTVIPEPSTTLLLGVLGALGLVRRRR